MKNNRTFKRKPIIGKVRWTPFKTFLLLALLFHLILIYGMEYILKIPKPVDRKFENVVIREKVEKEDILKQKPPEEKPGHTLTPTKTPSTPETPVNQHPPPSPVPPPPGMEKTNYPPTQPTTAEADPGMQKVFRMIEKNRYQQADKVIKNSLRKNPDNIYAIIASGELEKSRGRLDKAQKIFIKAAMMDDKNTLNLHSLTINSLLVDDPDNALKYYKKAAEVDEPDDHRKILLVEIYLHRGINRRLEDDVRWKEDAKSAEDAAKKVGEQDHPLLQVALGKLAMLRGERRKAIKFFEKSLDSKEIKDDYRIDILMSLAVLYTEIGEKEKAQKYIDQLVELMDKWTPAVYQRGLFVREYALLFKETFLGIDISPDDLFRHERFYRKLYKDKLQQPEVEVKQTLYIISEMVDMMYDEPEEVPIEEILDEINEYMSIAEGPKYPQCFFNKMVNRRIRYMVGYKLFGDVYCSRLKKKKALHYYNKALKLSPGNPVILKCMERAKKLK